jgi:hypothetical protein
MRKTGGAVCAAFQPQARGNAMPFLQVLAYVLLIVIGGIGIFIPGGAHVCIACGSLLDTILGILAIVVGIAGLATRGREYDA